jgi:O-antigen/teichoic acid export membrane protein
VANLLGAVVPALAALVTVPFIVRGLGEANYGVYALVTAIVGYFAVIDINVTAGSVKYIAEFSTRDDAARIGETICFSLVVYAALGAVGALGIYLGAQVLVTQVFSVPPALAAGAVATLELAALGFLVGQLQSYLHSVPQALMRFGLSGRLEVVFGSAVPLLSVAVLLRGGGLFDLVALRVLASALHCVLLWLGIRQLLPNLRLRWPRKRLARDLLDFSAFSFLSRFAALSYAYADKLIIGALAGVTALAYFTVAATLANRVLGLTYRLCGVFFPAASAFAASGQGARLRSAYLQASRYVTFLNAAMLVLISVFAYPILLLWMGAAFARHGAVVLALMALSQFVDSLTSLPSLVNDGSGHPRVSGLFALARAAAGLVAVWLGVLWDGIAGAAWGHLLASLVFSAAFLAYVHGRTVPASLADLWRRAYRPALSGVLAIALAALAARRLFDNSIASVVLQSTVTALLLAAYGLLVVLDKHDRALAWSHLRGRPA